MSSHTEGQKKMEKIRTALANYMFAEGCSCCCDIERHEKYKKELAELLDVPMYDDESGYNLSLFRSL